MIIILMNMPHRINPLHLYCRLNGWGMKSKSAMKITRYYERFLYKYLQRLLLLIADLFVKHISREKSFEYECEYKFSVSKREVALVVVTVLLLIFA